MELSRKYYYAIAAITCTLAFLFSGDQEGYKLHAALQLKDAPVHDPTAAPATSAPVPHATATATAAPITSASVVDPTAAPVTATPVHDPTAASARVIEEVDNSSTSRTTQIRYEIKRIWLNDSRKNREEYLPSFVRMLTEYSGMGSQLLNLFAASIYFEEVHNRTIILDETCYSHRYNKTVGLLTGYFSPQFPVINTVEQQQEWIKYNSKNYSHSTDEPWGQWENESALEPISFSHLIETRTRLFENHHPPYHAQFTESDEFYYKMVKMMCPHMQYNDQAVPRIVQLQRSRGIDFDSDHAAFHIRRGDKLETESKKYESSEYIEKLAKATNMTSFANCFVATDDYTAVEDLKKSNQTICGKIWTLAQPTKRVDNRPSYAGNEGKLLRFLAEIRMLVRAKYFVGTFNSNVGALVAVLRGCDGKDHYGQSFGVDVDHWYLR